MRVLTNKSGFSLVELMVVIAIIGILATLGLATYQNALKRSRDARRTGDIQDIAKAQEQIKGLTGSYVSVSDNSPCEFATAVIGDLSVPSDPGSLSYTCYGDGNNFCLSAQMEVNNNGNCSGCTNATTIGTTNNNHYCVLSKQ